MGICLCNGQDPTRCGPQAAFNVFIMDAVKTESPHQVRDTDTVRCIGDLLI
jgi:hypothetical protein